MGRKTDREHEAAEGISKAPRDMALGTKNPTTRKQLDNYLERFALEARASLERGGKITFNFKRRQATVKIEYPDLTMFEDYEGSDT